MSDQSNKSHITIKLEVSIPTNLAEGVQMFGAMPQPRLLSFGTLQLDHPTDSGSTFVRLVSGDLYVMCTYGSCSSLQHIAARTYTCNPDTSTIPATPPSGDSDVRTINVNGLSCWQISDLPVHGPLNEQKRLVLWIDDGTGYRLCSNMPCFSVTQSTGTYCELYGGSFSAFTSAQRPRQQDWSKMPDKWFFEVSGCSDRKFKNCECLNGRWLLKRDKQREDVYLWWEAFDFPIGDATQPSYWRLQFNHDDGFWYLQFIGDLDRGTENGIAYRLHESKWNPQGPNVLNLLTHNDYCIVPDSIKLVPY